MKKSIFLISLVFVFCFTASARQQDVMKNQDIILLVKAGLDSSVIIEKIRSSKTDFDLSTDALIKLKKEGVPDNVIGAMFKAKNEATKTELGSGVVASNSPDADPTDPMLPRNYGIYLYEEKRNRKMTQLMPTLSKSRAGGFLTSAIVPFGLGKTKLKATLQGPSSKIIVDNPNPVFYFYLDAQSGGLNRSGIPSSPSEFVLVKFHIRGNNREVSIAETNNFGGKAGPSKEYIVEFHAEDLGKGIFKVTPAKPLSNGEYGFYLLDSGESNTGAGVGGKFFDFSVKLIP